MTQYFMVKESTGYTVRVTSESGCNSSIHAWADTKRQAQAIIRRAMRLRRRGAE